MSCRKHPASAGAPIAGMWSGSYPMGQTLAAAALAVLATAAISIDPTMATYREIMKIDPTATGALYICYEVLLSFAGHDDAAMLLPLALLLVFPIRYVFFGRRDSWRPSVVAPALVFSVCMVVGKSYDLTDSAALIFGGISRTLCAVISLSGWAVLAHATVYLAYELLDWFGSHRLGFTEGRDGRLWRACDLLLNRHPYAVPLAALALAWAPAFAGSMPGLFMGDTGAQIRQWFNLPNGTSDYLNLIDPNVLLNGHHPVAHTALVGGCVQLGMAVLGDENAGLLLYTSAQFAVTAATTAYLVSSLRRFGVGMVPRAVALAFFALMPLFSNYAVLITKDVLFADALALLTVQTAKLLAPAASAARRVPVEIEPSYATGARIRVLPVEVEFAPRDWALLAAGCLGCAFFRNGGIAFPLVCCAVAGAARLRDARRAACAGGRTDRSWAGVAAVLVATAAAYLVFTNVFMPAARITPGSRREMLSIPFQQTARFVQKHDGAASGVKGGTADGLVTQEERDVIDRVLGYSDLGARYDPDKADSVKNGFNEDATAADLAAYFKAWAEMLVKDPEAYLSAFVSNYYGYVYPSEKDAFTYSSANSAEIMARPENRAYFDFHPATGPFATLCDQMTNLYRVAVQRIPPLSLVLSSAVYVWAMALACCYLVRERRLRALALFAPCLGVLAVCLVGPCNGATYLRYLYPAIMCLPFVAGASLVWPRRLG